MIILYFLLTKYHKKLQNGLIAISDCFYFLAVAPEHCVALAIGFVQQHIAKLRGVVCLCNSTKPR